MQTQFIALSGLPRAGSTVFTDILAQNPKIEVSSTSVLHMVLTSIRRDFTCASIAQAEPQDVITAKAEKAVKAFLQSYKVNDDKYYIDKGRAWPNEYEFLERLGLKPKIVLMIRDVRDAYASMEKLYRKGYLNLSVMRQGDPALEELQGMPYRMEQIHKYVFETPLNAMRDLLDRGLGDNVLWIRHEDLASDPSGTLDKFYEFTEIPVFDEHDFNHIEHVTVEDDRHNGIVGLHDINTKLHAPEHDYEEVLGKRLSDKIYQDNRWLFDVFYEEEGQSG